MYHNKSYQHMIMHRKLIIFSETNIILLYYFPYQNDIIELLKKTRITISKTRGVTSNEYE